MENPEVGAVRMYLEQMSDTPLLSRRQEVEAAKRIELYRKQFRSGLLATDYALRAAVKLLEARAGGHRAVGADVGRLDDQCSRRSGGSSP